ncbi:MAG: PTS transporter subunit EIIC, partial [Ruminococcus sp.]|nr:PTS transporter subunit EIIC [Ruminococcus sp.]
GYLLCPATMQGGDIKGVLPLIGFFMVKAGGAVIDHIALLFAVGIGVGLAKEHDGTAAIASLTSWLMITVLLQPDNAVKLIPSIADNKTAMLAFSKIENPFIGILAGNIGAACYNRFKDTKLPEWLGFFSGKRCTVIISGLLSTAVAAVLFFIWPVIFGGLVKLGNSISGMGSLGAGLYAFLNRLLLPFGLHHALNNVFWFDTIGIGDLTHFWAGDTSADVSWSLGVYMSGFFPCMMFGVPGAALAMIRSVPESRRRFARSVLISGAVCSLICGITEPFEFAFMFAAPMLYVVYSLLYGVFTYAAAVCGFRAGFAFSGGATDLLFSSSMPAAKNTWMIIPLGIAAFVVFYGVFRIMVSKLGLKTPGMEESRTPALAEAPLDMADMAAGVNIPRLLWGLGGKANLTLIDNCITRLRLEINDADHISEEEIMASGAKGIMRIGKTGLQVIIGLNVQSVADALKAAVKADTAETEEQQVIISCKAGKICQPVKGKVIPLEEVPDETFATGVLGMGVGICPEEDLVTSPVDGTVFNLTDTRHAAAIEAQGMEVLIHIGIDTVKMKGDGFECLVKEGDKVKTGQPLIRFDREKIRAAGLSDVTVVTLSNSEELEDVKCIR